MSLDLPIFDRNLQDNPDKSKEYIKIILKKDLSYKDLIDKIPDLRKIPKKDLLNTLNKHTFSLGDEITYYDGILMLWKKNNLELIYNFHREDFKLSLNIWRSKEFHENMKIIRTGNNIGKDIKNPWNITADSIPHGEVKILYGKKIGAIGTYISKNNGREYYVFPDNETGIKALQQDIEWKRNGKSTVMTWNTSLEDFQRIYVGNIDKNYLKILLQTTNVRKETAIKNVPTELLSFWIMRAEGFIKKDEWNWLIQEYFKRKNILPNL